MLATDYTVDLFQSAPLTGARGDHGKSRAANLPSEFQSAPLTGARGDANSLVTVSGGAQFQSAPLTGARGDVCKSSCASPYSVSIRSPDRSQGRPAGRRQATRNARRFNPLP